MYTPLQIQANVPPINSKIPKPPPGAGFSNNPRSQQRAHAQQKVPIYHLIQEAEAAIQRLGTALNSEASGLGAGVRRALQALHEELSAALPRSVVHEAIQSAKSAAEMATNAQLRANAAPSNRKLQDYAVKVTAACEHARKEAQFVLIPSFLTAQQHYHTIFTSLCLKDRPGLDRVNALLAKLALRSSKLSTKHRCSLGQRTDSNEYLLYLIAEAKRVRECNLQELCNKLGEVFTHGLGPRSTLQPGGEVGNIRTVILPVSSPQVLQQRAAFRTGGNYASLTEILRLRVVLETFTQFEKCLSTLEGLSW
jgi:hypothetical protein